MSKFEQTTYTNTKTILKHNEFVATPVRVDDAGISAVDGKKIVKAGTIIGGKTKSVLDNPTEPVEEKNDPAVAASVELEIDATPDAEVGILVTAIEPGESGNGIKVQLRNPNAANSPLSVSIDVDADTIIVDLETDGTDAVAAELEIDNAAPGENSKVTVTANEAGAAGNSIKVEFLNPSANDQDLAVNIVGDTIVVSLKTGGAGAIESTAKEVADAINAHLIVKPLVTAAYSGTGETVIEDHAAAALAGGANAIAGSIVSTVTEVIDAINEHFTAAMFVEAEATGDGDPDTTDAIAVAATALEDGDDGSGFEAEGVLLHDVDVTHGDAPGSMIVWGFIDKSKLDEDPCEDAVDALAGRILFFDV